MTSKTEETTEKSKEKLNFKIRIPETLRQYDLWRHIEIQIRWLKRIVLFQFIFHLALIFIIFVLAAQDVPVIRVDNRGEPILATARRKGNVPTPEEAEFAAREVSGYLIDFFPGALARDLSKGLSMMTREAAVRWKKKIDANQAALFELDRAKVRGQLSWPERPPSVITSDIQDGVLRYYITALARLNIYQSEAFTMQPMMAKNVKIKVQLRVVPRTSQRLSGLLVESFDHELAATPVAEADLAQTPPPTTPTVQLTPGPQQAPADPPPDPPQGRTMELRPTPPPAGAPGK